MPLVMLCVKRIERGQPLSEPKAELGVCPQLTKEAIHILAAFGETLGNAWCRTGARLVGCVASAAGTGTGLRSRCIRR